MKRRRRRKGSEEVEVEDLRYFGGRGLLKGHSHMPRHFLSQYVT